MPTNKIVYNGKSYNGNINILSGNVFMESSLSNEALTVDTMNAKIENSNEVGTMFVPKGSSGLLTSEKELFYVLPYIRVLVDDLSSYTYGAPVEYYHDDKLIGKYYMSSAKRVNKFTFEISCISAVGLLDNSIHYGGIYYGKPVKTLLADIIGGIIPYTLDARFENMAVYGWLPVASRRDNLKQLLFAEGASLRKDATGDLYITSITNDNPADIANDRMFTGGTVNLSSQANRADVYEHSYLKYDTDQEETLFEGQVFPSEITTPNGNIVSGVIVTFNAPVHSLAIESGTILESGVNYAVLSQSANAKLTGKKYTHTVRVVTKEKKLTTVRDLVSISDNVVTVKDATLVSIVNSENVADRMIAYYGTVKEVSVDFVVGEERPGDAISFDDPFGERNSGFISAMNIRMSQMLKASATFVSGYIPPNIGNNYTKFVVLTGTGEFTVPDDVTSIRVVLIGSGDGGQAGFNGENGANNSLWVTTAESASGGSWSSPAGEPGAGGDGGASGSGGKIFQSTVEISSEFVFSYKCSSGGIGGVKEGEIGTAGQETVFGNFSSKDGIKSDSGYINILSGAVYAKRGTDGLSGARGGKGGAASLDDVKDGENGENVKNFIGGLGGKGRYYNYDDTDHDTKSRYGGGGGGGAAFGENGHSAKLVGNLTDGANGGNGIILVGEISYGCGGTGGNAGGGGGSAGALFYYKKPYPHGGIGVNAYGGAGGLGSKGLNGGDGCVIVYY